MRRPEFLAKADVSPIIRGHLDTLVSARTGLRSRGDLFLFFGVPLVVGIILLAIGFGFRMDAVNGFLNSFAILTGLLLNLLVLVFSLSASSEKATVVRRNILKEVFINVCYSILVAITVVSTSLVDLGYMRSQQGSTTGKVSTFLLSSLTANFVLSLLMVMKRMYKLISTEFDISSKKRVA